MMMQSADGTTTSSDNKQATTVNKQFKRICYLHELYNDSNTVTPPPGYGFAPGYGSSQYQPRNVKTSGECNNCNQPCFCIAQKGDQ
ncbi:unnamed protein product, partial [Adineta ricciae]